MSKKFTIKSEDKAAFINRLEKLGIAVDTYSIKDDKLNGTFSIEFTNPQVIDMINQVLKRSRKINQVKSSKSVYTDKKASKSDSALKEEKNPRDVIKMDVPLFIRLLEYAREDAKTDMDLHDVTEKVIALASEGQVLTMTDYDHIMTEKIQEIFNPNDYEWEKDPEFLRRVGELGVDNFVKCEILTTSGKKEIIDFEIDNAYLGEIEPYSEIDWICYGTDSDGIWYEMECTVRNSGLDGDYITDIKRDTLTVRD